MKKILLVCFVFVSYLVFALSVNESGAIKYNTPESSLKLLSLQPTCAYRTYNVIFMPISLAKDKQKEAKQIKSEDKYESYVGQVGNVKLANKFESYVINRIVSKLNKIPYLFYGKNESVAHVYFIKPGTDLVSWQNDNADDLFTSLHDLSITESMVLPEDYINRESDAKYIMFSKVSRVQILENKDVIPYTNLVSLIASVNMQVFFAVVSATDGVIVKKFVATGHSGISKLLEKTDHDTGYDVNLLIDDAFNNLMINIQDSMNDDRFNECIYHRK